VLVTPDFDVQPSPLSEYYVHLDQRLEELQNLMGSQGAVLPSTYEKYLHGNVPAGVTGNPLVSAKEYYEQLKQLRADSQVRWGARSCQRAGGRAGKCRGAHRRAPEYPLLRDSCGINTSKQARSDVEHLLHMPAS
jgi:hypothetical protein